VPGILLFLLAALAFLPALRCGFVWDDDAYVTENPLLTSAHGLHDIWFSAHTQSQYFPLVYTTFRFERLLWGLNPFGFHLVNILLHGVNAVLVWVVLRRLRAPGAWLAAAIFAVHPVQVETVAWVTELKNIESLLFYLLSLLAWIEFVDAPGGRHWRYYGLALTACLLALFAKTTACTLPATMWLVLWVRKQRISWLRAAQIVPFLIAGFGMGLITVWWEKHLGNYDERFGLSLSLLQRVLLAGRALWFYAGKLAWPTGLAFSYPHWEISVREPLQYVPLAGCAAVAAVLWRWQDRIGRGVLAGIIFFVAALSPLLGFINEYTFFYSYVADHYQYTAGIGLIAVFASGVWSWCSRKGCLGPAQGGLLVLLGCLTWHQCGAYQNRETLWRDTLAKNPDSWMAHHNLGIELFGQGRLDEALDHYQTAVRLYPKGDREQSDLGTALMEKGLYPEAIEHLEAALAINAQLFQAQNNLALTYSRTGQYQQAVSHFRKALAIKPDALGVMLNLGRALHRQGELDEAISDYREASARFPSEVEPLRRLAGVLAEKGQFSQAAQACRQALRIAPNSPDLEQQLLLLEGNKAD
jgi:tetratricopeptide (TPR) repeat protein